MNTLLPPTNTPALDLIFADGFESSNLSAWSASNADAGDLSVSAAAALVSTRGMQAVIDENNNIFVTDNRPAAEPRYRARFYFDPNSIPMVNGDAHLIFNGFMGTSTEVLRVEFRRSSNAYQIRSRLINDGSTWTNTNWFTISDSTHFIEIDWRAATAAGANNGGLTLWIDGAQQADLTGVDNDTRRIDRVRLGAVAEIDLGTRGTYFFDAFESRRGTYIGPAQGLPAPTATKTSPPAPTATNTPSNTPGSPTNTPTRTPTPTRTSTPLNTPTPTSTSNGSDLIFADGFESGNVSAWSSNSTDAGDLGVISVAALVGSQGLQAVIDDNNAIYLNDDSPNAELRYRARFYFDPNSIAMASGDTHIIFKGFAGTSTQVLKVEFLQSAGVYQIRASLLNDASSFTNSTFFTISDAVHFIEIDWRAATAAGANNGGLTLWIDGAQRANLTGVDNDTRRVDRVRLGATSAIDTGTRGTYYFDAFESRRQSFIGP
jgi:hypothetical protein